jgi:hypothetical protein
MGIQTLVLFVGVAAALGVSYLAAASGASMRTAGLIAVGFVPLLWALGHLIERVIGRGIWDFAAPYPYRWMDTAPTCATTRGRCRGQPLPEVARVLAQL